MERCGGLIPRQKALELSRTSFSDEFAQLPRTSSASNFMHLWLRADIDSMDLGDGEHGEHETKLCLFVFVLHDVRLRLNIPLGLDIPPSPLLYLLI